MPETTRDAVLSALSRIHDPDLGRDIVSLGFVRDVKICDGTVSFDIELTTPACPVKDEMQQQAVSAVSALPGVTKVHANMTASVPAARVRAIQGLENVRNIVAVASGKGGVGKSTVSVNLAVALSRLGARVGLMDSDIYGPSLPAMLGAKGQPAVTEDRRMVPLSAHGIRFISLGLLVGDDAPVIWRGPMASKMVQQLLGGVAWGELDYLLVDLPPGTGDVQLTLTQAAPLAGAVIVTTPQDVALAIARRGLRMFQEVSVPVLGIIENMSHFECDGCGKRHDIFRSGGGRRIAAELSLPLLGEIPLDASLCEAGDQGVPLVAGHPDSAAARAFLSAARKVAARLSVANVEAVRAKASPTEIAAGERELRITWDDGHVSLHPFRALREECPCAVCRDEWTGRRRLRAGEVRADVAVLSATPVGRYALSISFSDGHSTGIYGFALLRSLCACAGCAKEPVAAG